jgi:hypothetical protein
MYASKDSDADRNARDARNAGRKTRDGLAFQGTIVPTAFDKPGNSLCVASYTVEDL